MLTRVGGHWELRAASLLKAVWWGMRLATASLRAADARVWKVGQLIGLLLGRGKTDVGREILSHHSNFA